MYYQSPSLPSLLQATGLYIRKVIDHMPSTRVSSKAVSILIGATTLLLTISIVTYPEVAFDASLHGLRLWFDVVLPSLLPFFAMAEIMIGLGVVHFVGVLVEPVMLPVFRIPGTGAFAVAMGLASGYPIGAKITGRLCRDGLCNRVEGERLVSFANTADPLFMIGAVAVGMFGLKDLGKTLAVAHYIAALLVGFVMRFHGTNSGLPPTVVRQNSRGNIFSRALQSMHQARIKDGRPFGQLFADALKDTISSMLFVGGCIMMFSVAIRVLTEAGAIDWLSSLIGHLLSMLQLSEALVPALLRGVFEITIGCQASSEAAASLLHKAMAASAVIGWSGLSVHTQVAAMIHGTNIRLSPYLFARALHGVLAAIVTFVLMVANPAAWNPEVSAALAQPGSASSTLPFLTRIAASSSVAGSLALVAAGLIVFAWLWKRVTIVSFRVKR